MSEALNYLPLFLVVATFVSGILWGHDRMARRPKRLAAAAALDERTPLAARGPNYEAARAALLAEPAAMEWGGSFFPLLALVLVVRSFLFEPFVIPSGSMLPTLQVGDYILVNKYRYGLRLPVLGTKVLAVGEPARGDVMVFYPPHLDSYYIKRVIGLPGDRVSYDNRELFINGERVALEALGAGEEGLQRFVETLGVVKHEIQYEPGRLRRPQEWRVPADAFLVFGDNRDRSADSRSWGYVPEANVIGQAVAIWMHKAPGLALPRFHRNGAIE